MCMNLSCLCQIFLATFTFIHNYECGNRVLCVDVTTKGDKIVPLQVIYLLYVWENAVSDVRDFRIMLPLKHRIHKVTSWNSKMCFLKKIVENCSTLLKPYYSFKLFLIKMDIFQDKSGCKRSFTGI